MHSPYTHLGTLTLKGMDLLYVPWRCSGKWQSQPAGSPVSQPVLWALIGQSVHFGVSTANHQTVSWRAAPNLLRDARYSIHSEPLLACRPSQPYRKLLPLYSQSGVLGLSTDNCCMVTANLGFILPYRCLISVVYGNKLPQQALTANIASWMVRKTEWKSGKRQRITPVQHSDALCFSVQNFE